MPTALPPPSAASRPTHGVKKVLLVGRWSLYTSGSYGQPKDGYFLVEDDPTRWNEALSRRAFERGLNRTLAAYRAAGAEVAVLLQVPQQEVAPPKLYARFEGLYGPLTQDHKRSLLEQSSILRTRHADLQALSRETILSAAQAHGAQVMDPDPLFCDADRCAIGELDLSFYSDQNHLSASGVRRLKPLLDAHLLQP